MICKKFRAWPLPGSRSRKLESIQQRSPFRERSTRGALMQLKPFLLDAWLDNYEHGIEFNLAASTGPVWTANQLLDLGGDKAREQYLNHKVIYGRPAGGDALRAAIAEMQNVDVD